MGTANLEVKLAHWLAYKEQEALHEIFIGLRKAYDTMDREQCIGILKGYGVEPNMLSLLHFF